VSARTVRAIAGKEFRSAFASPVAYAYLVVFLAFTSWFFFRGFFVLGLASLRGFFGLLPWTLLFLLPALTMRLFAEEQRLGTLEVLLTWPVREHEAVLGKFLGSFGLLAVSLAATLPLPATVFSLGRPDPGPVLAGYLGLLLLGAAYLAIGLFASALTENQIVAYITGVAVTFALFVAGEDFVLVAAPASLVPALRGLGLGAHYWSIGRGVVDSRDLVYFGSVIFLFLYLTVRRLEGRRW
jgi:ABC-2 type transport system permease protein